MRRSLVPLAIGMAVLYLALAVGAAGCLVTPFGPPDTGHHHQASHVAHSPLCAWACQASPTVSALVEAPLAAIFQIVVLLTFTQSTRPMRLTVGPVHPRAPPFY